MHKKKNSNNPLIKKNKLQKSRQQGEFLGNRPRRPTPFTATGQTQEGMNEELAEQGFDDDSGFTGVPRENDENATEEGEKIA